MARKKKTAAKVGGVKYFTHAHNVKGCLTNGSFCRVYPDGRIAQYMNGDFMGAIAEVPATMKEVDYQLAISLIPNCCKLHVT